MSFVRVAVATLLIFLAAVAGSFAADPVVIDVRTELEWNAGHLEGAVLIPFDRIGDEIDRVAPDTKQRLYLYCRSGRRSGIAAQTLKNIGYEDIVDLGTLDNASRTLGRPVVR